MTPAPMRDTQVETRPVAGIAGSLVLIGGALDEDPTILRRIVSLARDARRARDARGAAGARAGDGSAPRIAILTTASEPARSAASAADDSIESDEADGRYYAELLARHGAIGVPIPVGVSPEPPYPGSAYHRGSAESETIAELVRSCDGVFLGGGDQTHYVLALFRSTAAPSTAGAGAAAPPFGERRDTLAMAAVRDVLHRGGVIAGTSAGLAVQQGRCMVSGGTSREGWLRGAAPGYEADDALRYLPAGGFGFFDEGLLDSHFAEWGRIPRAIRLAGATGHRLAVGVDEGTALIHSPRERSGEVVGTGAVSILDLSAAEFGEGAFGPAVLGVRWHRLTNGDRFDFGTGIAVRASEERLAPGDGPAPETARDTWGEDRGPALPHLALRLLASSGVTASAETAPDDGIRFRIALHRDDRTIWTETGGFTGLALSITPIPPHR